MARSSAPVEKWVGLLEWWTTTTVLVWTVVVGAVVAGTVVVEVTVGVDVGIGVVPVAEVELGATVPGWAPFGAVVVPVGVLAAGVDEVDGLVVAVVVAVVVEWTRAEAGIEMPSAGSLVTEGLAAAAAGAALRSRLSRTPTPMDRARAFAKDPPRARVIAWSTTDTHPC